MATAGNEVINCWDCRLWCNKS